MAKKIKTKTVVRDIKEHSESAVKDKVKEVGIRTKDKAVEKVSEQFTQKPNQQKTQNPETYATDKVTDTAETVTRTTAEKTGNTIKKTANRIKEKRAVRSGRYTDEQDNPQNEHLPEEQKAEQADTGKKDTARSVKEKKKQVKERKQNDTLEQRKESAKGKQANAEPLEKDKKSPSGEKPKGKGTIKEKESPTPKGKTSETIEPAKRDVKPKTRKKASIKTREKPSLKKSASEKPAIKQLKADAHKIKQTKRNAGNVKRTIRTAERSGKSAGMSVKSAKQTAEKTAKTAKKAEKTAKVTVQATAKAVKAAAKVVADAAKAAVAASKEIIAAIIAGGPVAIVIVVICLLAAVGGTCFGIFLSNDESTGTKITMSRAISQLTSEYYNSLTVMKLQYTYDTIEMNGDLYINWKDVLAIYAVKYTNAADGFEVATIDNDKLSKLKKIVQDMNPCTGIVMPKLIPVTTVTTTRNGTQVRNVTYETKKVLMVTAAHISAAVQAERYHFSDEQKKQLNELMSDEYNALWDYIIGSTDEILTPGGSYTGTDIFAWPLSVEGRISSHFGTRADPITGVVKTHGGTDIAAAQGTPILAAADGTVITAAYNDGGYGYYVKIQHNTTFATLYGHCSVLHVKAGQQVKQGQVIAEVGSTGHSTGNHLHFEVIQNGVRVDAMKYYNSIND